MVRDSEKTKQIILKTAETEFAEKGLAGARVDEIARVSGFNKSLIYQYFGNKEKLYQIVLYNAYGELSKLETSIFLENKDYIETIKAIVRGYFRFLTENPHFVKLLMWENLNEARYLTGNEAGKIKDPMINALKKILSEGKKTGVFSEKVDNDQVVLALIMGCYSYFSNIYTLPIVTRIDLSNEEVLEKRIEFVINSLLYYLSGKE